VLNVSWQKDKERKGKSERFQLSPLLSHMDDDDDNIGWYVVVAFC
jgi:hypothetical protein